MDPATMAATATTLLLPYIKKGGEKLAETLGEKVPAEVAKVWKAVTSRFKGKAAAEEAVKDLALRADDPDCQAAFRKELRKLLETNPDFISELARLLAAASADTINNVGSGAVATHGGVAAGEAGIAVGGSVHGDISSQGGSVLQPGSSVTVVDGQFAGRDLKIINNRYEGRPPKKKGDKRRIYLDVLACLVNRLPMRAFDTSQSNPNAAARELSLVNVYTTLDTTDQIKPEDAEKRQGKLRQPELPERGETRPLRALEAAARRRQLILLGEPGSGKTTFVHHLIYCLARNEVEGGAPWLEDFRRDWPEADRNLLPIRVILRDFDMWLANAGRKLGQITPRDLRDFIAHLLTQQNLDFASELVDEALNAGKALVVLDGLDEVASLRQRELVRDAIAAFADRYRGNRFLITCRTWSYQPPEERSEIDLRLPQEAFPTAQLAPFDDKKIDQFIAAWHEELVDKQKLSQAKVDVLRPKLMLAVRQPDLRRLAGNPLQLTLMAWVHTDGEELPDKRAQLYAKAVDLLLWRWEMQKPDVPGVQTLCGYANEVTDGDGRGKIERALWRAAFEAHTRLTSEAQRENLERLADVDETQLKKELAA